MNNKALQYKKSKTRSLTTRLDKKVGDAPCVE